MVIAIATLSASAQSVGMSSNIFSNASSTNIEISSSKVQVSSSEGQTTTSSNVQVSSSGGQAIASSHVQVSSSRGYITSPSIVQTSSIAYVQGNGNIYYIANSNENGGKVTTVASANLEKSDVLLSPSAPLPSSYMQTSNKNLDKKSVSSENSPVPGEINRSEGISSVFSHLMSDIRSKFNLE